ncbi:MAG: hypothetical protein WBG90_00975 [Saonia sp.]
MGENFCLFPKTFFPSITFMATIAKGKIQVFAPLKLIASNGKRVENTLSDFELTDPS